METDVISPFIIEAAELALDDLENLTYFLDLAKSLARPAISHFQVGAIAIGESGQAYLGVNLEFPGQPLSQTIHAEQFALTLARLYGETRLTHLVVSAMPCGYCRQFLQELKQPELPITVVHNQTISTYELDELLPYPFILGEQGEHILSQCTMPLTLTENKTDPPILQALSMASSAYVPYTQTYAGVVIILQDEQLFWGSAMESAAYNPSLSAFQAALVHLVSEQADYFHIAEVIFVELDKAKTSNGSTAWNLVKSLSPLAKLSFYTAILENDPA